METEIEEIEEVDEIEYLEGVLSYCCDALITETGICSQCSDNAL